MNTTQTTHTVHRAGGVSIAWTAPLSKQWSDYELACFSVQCQFYDEYKKPIPKRCLINIVNSCNSWSCAMNDALASYPPLSLSGTK